jgi:organic hydroperoxide reductase OsmC/OhrA
MQIKNSVGQGPMLHCMSAAQTFTVELEQIEGYEFRVRFGDPAGSELGVDEPPPLGGGKGPNAARMIAAAVGNCLAASLVFCLRGKFKEAPGPVRATAVGRLERNERGRYRIAGIDVTISVAEGAEPLRHLDRCLAQFEDFCIVTQSIRSGIPVNVRVTESSLA